MGQMKVKLIVEPKNVTDYFPKWDKDQLDVGNAYIDITQSMDDETHEVDVQTMIVQHGVSMGFYNETLPVLERMGLITIQKDGANG